MKVKLRWKKYSSASGYYIYRATSSNGTYKKIAKVSKNKTSYINKNLKKGAVYYYRVVAYGKKGTSAYSATKKVKVK